MTDRDERYWNRRDMNRRETRGRDERERYTNRDRRTDGRGSPEGWDRQPGELSRWGMPRGHQMAGYDRDHLVQDLTTGPGRGMSAREADQDRDWYGMRTHEEHYARQDMGGMYDRGPQDTDMHDRDMDVYVRRERTDRERRPGYVIGNERGETSAGVFGSTHPEYGREDARGAVDRGDRYRPSVYEDQGYGARSNAQIPTGGMRGGPAGYGYAATDLEGDVGYRDLRYGGAADSGRQGLSGMGSSAQGRHYGRGPRNYRRSDDRIREEINDALTAHGNVDATDIEVQVVDGEVTLSGSVRDRHQKRMAYDAAEDVRGVRDVHNIIRVRQEREEAQGDGEEQ